MAVRIDNCATRFSKNFAEKSFLFKSCVRTAKLQHSISISAMCVSGPWEAVGRTVEVESAISTLVASASEPRLTDVRTVIFELRFLP
jgi:hypothetical protein